MSVSSLRPAASAAAGSRPFFVLLPITLAVFAGFLVIGLPMPVLPLHLQGALGLSPTGIGAIIAVEFAAALLSRAWAGGLADRSGARLVMLTGFALAALSGLILLLSVALLDRPVWSLAVVFAARAVLGGAESAIVTGALAWGVGRVGPAHAGKVMAWVGMAIYGAYAAGAQLGSLLYQHDGFTGIAIASLLVPAVGCVTVLPLARPTVSGQRRTPFYKVLRLVLVPGLGLALCSIGFGGLTVFAALLFADRHWGDAGPMFLAFGAAFIGARLLFSHLPDRLGGARVALVCVLIEALGQGVIWAAGTPAIACLGAALTGFGYSLAFPGFGVEAVRRAPPEARGLAMGAYVAFLDIALSVTGPLAGLIAGWAGVSAVYLAGAGVVLLSAGVALALCRPVAR